MPYLDRDTNARAVFLVDLNGNPMVASGASGPQPASGSQSVTPATDSAPFPVGGTFTTALPSLTNGQRSTLQLDGSGRLIVKVADSRFARSGFANGFNQFSSFSLVADDGGSGPLNVAMTYQDPANNNGFTARGDTNGLYNVSTASGAAAVGLTPVTAVNVSSLVVKATAGNFYGGAILAGATAGFLIAYNAASAPASGAALNAAQILGVVQVAANGSAALGEYTIPDRFGTGIVLLFSTSTTTYAVPANNALFLRGRAI